MMSMSDAELGKNPDAGVCVGGARGEGDYIGGGFVGRKTSSTWYSSYTGAIFCSIRVDICS